MSTTVKRTLRPGDAITVELPHSEVCMHMGVAGRVMVVAVIEVGCRCGHGWLSHTYEGGVCRACEVPGCLCGGYRASILAQIIDGEGRDFSAPITLGEAGIYGTVAEGLYAYEVVS